MVVDIVWFSYPPDMRYCFIFRTTLRFVVLFYLIVGWPAQSYGQKVEQQNRVSENPPLFLFDSELPDSLDGLRRELKRNVIDVVLRSQKYLLVFNKVPLFFPENIEEQFILKYKIRTQRIGKYYRLQLFLFEGVAVKQVKSLRKIWVPRDQIVSRLRFALYEFIFGKKFVEDNEIPLKLEAEKRVAEIRNELKKQEEITKEVSNSFLGEASNLDIEAETVAISQLSPAAAAVKLEKMKQRLNLYDLLVDRDIDIDMSKQKRRRVEKKLSEQIDNKGKLIILKIDEQNSRIKQIKNGETAPPIEEITSRQDKIETALALQNEEENSKSDARNVAKRAEETWNVGKSTSQANSFYQNDFSFFGPWKFWMIGTLGFLQENVISLGIVNVDASLRSLGGYGFLRFRRPNVRFPDLWGVKLSYVSFLSTEPKTPPDRLSFEVVWASSLFRYFYIFGGLDWSRFDYFALNRIWEGVQLNSSSILWPELGPALELYSHSLQLLFRYPISVGGEGLNGYSYGVKYRFNFFRRYFGIRPTFSGEYFKTDLVRNDTNGELLIQGDSFLLSLGGLF
ncbi:MAG: hypothetical protein A2504_10080 [Bdellovibrionales bacterium RIFOXYD12_FULL_39_22]|nr:MAG: hypothetical protein A2385_17715 [Bdellovibrionales bacterium RIFOXYB1_FULL_39_21]OFZ43957.1 MAG: hypothetical protein A2485_04385 [Bdellovibrionales bacterium RIFOXYC12_FULL_39_17]OFZ48329.1 MAG: hypothetical protein A2404_01800 [Bdellovibrionales bacterium RIFOXYC1_FULL_39_130]OFZ76634.1 MAG: hypothetical protein A2560_17395 [Bdellovibrionales bacterium RIFOXYD1_FULL_39_84]OFZ94920.1 MAG: hypothetical protein A2504_10080 [Bdellovibrionales bacterium RIFOXYD12_FULL_39_22]HLE12658.1 hy